MLSQPEAYRHMLLIKNLTGDDEDNFEQDNNAPSVATATSYRSWCRCTKCGPMFKNIEKKCSFEEDYKITNFGKSEFIP